MLRPKQKSAKTLLLPNCIQVELPGKLKNNFQHAEVHIESDRPNSINDHSSRVPVALTSSSFFFRTAFAKTCFGALPVPSVSIADKRLRRVGQEASAHYTKQPRAVSMACQGQRSKGRALPVGGAPAIVRSLQCYGRQITNKY